MRVRVQVKLVNLSPICSGGTETIPKLSWIPHARLERRAVGPTDWRTGLQTVAAVLV